MVVENRVWRCTFVTSNHVLRLSVSFSLAVWSDSNSSGSLGSGGCPQHRSDHNVSASSAPIVLIVVGVVVFFIAFFGCCGAWKESYCMVTMVCSRVTWHAWYNLYAVELLHSGHHDIPNKVLYTRLILCPHRAVAVIKLCRLVIYQANNCWSHSNWLLINKHI